MSAAGASPSGQPSQEIQEPSRGLAAVLKNTKAGVHRDTVKSAIKVMIDEVMADSNVIDQNALRTLVRMVEQLDAKITKQLRAVMHHEKFSRLEGSWRGLRHLVFNTETATDLQIKVMGCTKEELANDLKLADRFDQSEIHKKIYRDEFGMAGGNPYAALVGDYQIENNSDDIQMLAEMSQVAAAAFCPFLTSPAPSMFDLTSWTGLPDPLTLEASFNTPKFIEWNTFRETEDSRFVAMTFPRVLARKVYGKGGNSVKAFNFQEADLDSEGNPTAQDHHEFCWMNAAYALAARITAAYSQTGFCTRILSHGNGGGKVEDLPVFAFRNADGLDEQKCPTEINIDDRRANEIGGLGFMPLVHWKRSSMAVFLTGDTAQKPKAYDQPQATENAQASAWLPYIMATGRLTHFMKAIGRDNLGRFVEAEDLEKELTRWLSLYVCSQSNPDEKQKSQLPLQDAKVEVMNVPGKAGEFSARVWMRPWTMMRALTASMSIVTSIPKGSGG